MPISSDTGSTSERHKAIATIGLLALKIVGFLSVSLEICCHLVNHSLASSRDLNISIVDGGVGCMYEAWSDVLGLLK